jgi:hypothetical protein
MARPVRAPRHAPSRPLSLAQKRALVALVVLCGDLGRETDAGVVARVSGLKPNVAVLALTGLVRRQLAVRFDDPDRWAPTFSGRSMARYVRAREPRSAPVAQFRTSDG